jgi:diaminobutyrate-2-oxoglutarate transaminase
LNDAGSGVDKPAAVVVETVQGEGGVNVASWKWLRNLEKLCRRHDILLIVDDIQMGNGRTGSFFSFEVAGIKPDMVCLSKAIGGLGLPMALLLIRPELDQWNPGEHNGTFRGNNLAFVAATKALDYWRDKTLEEAVIMKGLQVRERLDDLADRFVAAKLSTRGRGLIQGLVSDIDGFAAEVCREAFANGLILETAGINAQVAKVMPPLTIDEAVLEQGLDIVERAVATVAARRFPNRYAKYVA